jgi:hypothetical protein
MDTIISNDGKLIVHGVFVKWVDGHGGFEFDGINFRNQYCNTDFWKIIFNHNPLERSNLCHCLILK